MKQYYAGLDVHKATISIALLDASGRGAAGEDEANAFREVNEAACALLMEIEFASGINFGGTGLHFTDLPSFDLPLSTLFPEYELLNRRHPSRIPPRLYSQPLQPLNCLT